jgi:hypothetical protein
MDKQPVPAYEPSKAELDKIKNALSYHPVQNPMQAKRYEDNRAAALEFAEALMENCPPSEEFTLALINLRQAMNWANAAIAINE